MAELDPAAAQAAAEEDMQDAQETAEAEARAPQEAAEGATEAPAAADGSDNDSDWTPGGWGDGIGDDAVDLGSWE